MDHATSGLSGARIHVRSSPARGSSSYPWTRAATRRGATRRSRAMMSGGY